MKKPAETRYPIHPLIAERWSPRVFDPDHPVDEIIIHSMTEAARWAPSSGNDQPWSFILFNDRSPAELEKARECLSRGNAWAKKAPLLILTVARTCFFESTKENRHAFHDVGLATENLLLQAFHLGLIAHPMAGFDQQKAAETFKLPANHLPVTMIAIGFPGNVDTAEADLKERELSPRKRKLSSEFVFRGMWGK